LNNTYDYKNLHFTDQQIKNQEYKEHLGSKSRDWDFVSLFQFQFLKHLGLLPENSLLEFGCGPARASEKFIEYLNSDNYTGVDINESFIKIATENTIKFKDKNPRFYCIDDFQIPAMQVDYVFAWSVLNHIDSAKYQSFIDAIFSLMKLNGRLITTGSNWFNNVNLPDGLVVTKEFKNNDEILSFIGGSNFIDNFYVEKFKQLRNNSELSKKYSITSSIVEITRIK
jgi:SAM-dependent methyltransferase